MNIVMFTDAYWPRVNGVTVSVDSFSRALAKAGHNVLIVCSSYPDDLSNTVSLDKNPEEENNLKILKVSSMPFPAKISKEDRIAHIHKWNWVFRNVEGFNPNLVHIHTELTIGECGFWYARTHNVPVVYTNHTMWEEYGPYYVPMLPAAFVKFVIRRIYVSVLGRSYRVIAPTAQIEALIRRYRKNTPTTVLPTGIDKDLFNHSEEEIKQFRSKLENLYPVLKGKRILLFAGRLGREKNVSFLIRILPEVLKKHGDAVLLLAGDGPDKNFFQDEAHNAGIADSCLFTGYFTRKDLALVYAVSELFLFPSMTDTQGLVTLEAMLSGTPVVAIGAMGTLTTMGGDNGGFMVDNDEAEFTARVLALLGDRELRLRKSVEAREHADQWSVEELTKKLEKIYEEAASSYTKEFGYPITPLWDLIIDKRWWSLNRKILKKKALLNWNKMLERIRR